MEGKFGKKKDKKKFLYHMVIKKKCPFDSGTASVVPVFGSSNGDNVSRELYMLYNYSFQK